MNNSSKKAKDNEARVKKQEEEWVRNKLDLPYDYKVDLDANTINIPISTYSNKVYWDLRKYKEITRSMDDIDTLVSIVTNVYENIKAVMCVGGFILFGASIVYFILAVIPNILPAPFEPSLCYIPATLGLLCMLLGNILPNNENSKIYRFIKSMIIKNKMKRIDNLKERYSESSWKWM